MEVFKRFILIRFQNTAHRKIFLIIFDEIAKLLVRFRELYFLFVTFCSISSIAKQSAVTFERAYYQAREFVSSPKHLIF